MDAVNAFNQELFSLLDMKPPISRAKMISITKSAIKAIKLYKHVVQIVEKFIKRCKPEYKVPGLYVVDSIVRQSRHQFGPEKDVFGPRFTKNITGTFQNLYLCPAEDKSKIVRVLNLWQKNGVFKIEIIQPLLDMAAGSTSSVVETDLENDTGNAGSPSPVKVLVEPPPTLATNLAPAVPQLPNSDAFAAVAQLFQSTQGQQLQQILQTFQQPPKPQSPVVDNTMVQVQVLSSHLKSPSSQPNELKTTFDKKLLDRFDYDDEPEGGEEFKKEDSTPPPIPAFGLPDCIPQPAFSQHPGHVPNMEHFQQHMVGLQQDLSLQVHLPPNGEIHGYGLMPPAQFPPVVQSVPPILPPPTTSVSSFPPNFTPQNEPFTQKPSQQVTGVPPIPVQPPTFPGHMGIPPPGFPPGIPPPPPPPPPPFLRPGFNPLQMPPGFLPPAPLPPLGTGASLPTNNSSVVPVSAPQINPKEDSNQDSGRNFIASVPRNASETTDGTKIYGAVPGLNSGINPGLPAPSLHVSLQSQISVHGNQTGGPTGPVMNIPPPSGGLLGARPGMIPLQRPPGVPPPHLQRFPILPPRPNVPMPPQMMQRGPPPGPGGFGMPPPHTVRAPFSPHGPFVRQGGPGAPAGSRGPEGPEERDARQFRNDRQSFGHGRDRDQERFARRSFSGSGRGEPDGRDRYSNRHDDYERPVGGRDRRDWGRSPEHDRHRDFEDRNKVSSSYRDRDRISRDRESCRDRVDSHVKDKSELDNSDKTEKYGHANNKEPPTDSGKESIKSESETAKVCDMPVDPKSEPNLSTEEIRNTEQAQ
uniref:CID domain-containing protein n=1 Tax=Erpetoichthys calabaricus TaxID=27687 RepID=A0A8C4RR10_ERPCA